MQLKSIIKKTVFVILSFCLAQITFGQSRIIIIGAHPDDCELNAGGLAIKLIEKGHKVKFVSMTNGNKGHHLYSAEEIEKIRRKEAQLVQVKIGCDYEMLDNNDGELLNSIEQRDKVIELIREWKADIVITHPEYDYHPDHRNTALIVQDAAFMVTVPLYLPSVPYLKDNPLFLYMLGRIENPNREFIEIVVDITPQITEKALVLESHYSQFFEWLPWINQEDIGHVDITDFNSRITYLEEFIKTRNRVTPNSQAAIERFYGKEHQAEAIEKFEICPFGKKTTCEELREILPVFGVPGKF